MTGKRGTEGRLSQVAARFDGRAESYDSQSLWVNEPRMSEVLLVGLRRGARILDVGAGTGAIGLQATRMGHWTVCTDISAGMLLRARGKGLPTVRADMHRLPFSDHAFDVIVVRQALQYSDLSIALREFARVVASEIRIGQIVARDGEDQANWQTLFDLMGQRTRRVFARGEIEQAASSDGFRVHSILRLEGRERLVSPNLNAEAEVADWKAISELISKIDPEAVRDGDEWVHRVAWEFLTLECGKSNRRVE